MRKEIFLIGIVAIAIVILLFFFPIEQTPNTTKAYPYFSSSQKVDVKIQINTKSSSNILLSDRSCESTMKEKIGKKILFKTQDSYRHYNIFLVGDNNLGDISQNYDYFRVFGTIGSGKFVLKLPRKIIGKKIQLMIVDEQHNKKKIIDTSFLSELNSLSNDEELHISIDPMNLTIKETIIQQKKSVLPFVP